MKVALILIVVINIAFVAFYLKSNQAYEHEISLIAAKDSACKCCAKTQAELKAEQ